ncbi:MAG TPA: hypothetical protein VFZ01_09920 [Geminicoccaceae bacterium]
MSARSWRRTTELRDLLGPQPGQRRRTFGRVREARYLRPGLRPLARDQAIWPRRLNPLILPGWAGDIIGRC